MMNAFIIISSLHIVNAVAMPRLDGPTVSQSPSPALGGGLHLQQTTAQVEGGVSNHLLPPSFASVGLTKPEGGGTGETIDDLLIFMTAEQSTMGVVQQDPFAKQAVQSVLEKFKAASTAVIAVQKLPRALDRAVQPAEFTEMGSDPRVRVGGDGGARQQVGVGGDGDSQRQQVKSATADLERKEAEGLDGAQSTEPVVQVENSIVEPQSPTTLAGREESKSKSDNMTPPKDSSSGAGNGSIGSVHVDNPVARLNQVLTPLPAQDGSSSSPEAQFPQRKFTTAIAKVISERSSTSDEVRSASGIGLGPRRVAPISNHQVIHLPPPGSFQTTFSPAKGKGGQDDLIASLIAAASAPIDPSAFPRVTDNMPGTRRATAVTDVGTHALLAPHVTPSSGRPPFSQSTPSSYLPDPKSALTSTLRHRGNGVSQSASGRLTITDSPIGANLFNDHAVGTTVRHRQQTDTRGTLVVPASMHHTPAPSRQTGALVAKKKQNMAERHLQHLWRDAERNPTHAGAFFGIVLVYMMSWMVSSSFGLFRYPAYIGYFMLFVYMLCTFPIYTGPKFQSYLEDPAPLPLVGLLPAKMLGYPRSSAKKHDLIADLKKKFHLDDRLSTRTPDLPFHHGEGFIQQVVRTREDRFRDLPDFKFKPRYVDLSSHPAIHPAIDSPSENGSLRMAYIETGTPGKPVLLFLHGVPAYGFMWRHVINHANLERDFHIIVPDLIGFGRSDKPTHAEDYSYDRHVNWLKEFITKLKLYQIACVGHDFGGMIGLRVMAEMRERFERFVLTNSGLPIGEGGMVDGFVWKDFAHLVPIPQPAAVASRNNAFKEYVSIMATVPYHGFGQVITTGTTGGLSRRDLDNQSKKRIEILFI